MAFTDLLTQKLGPFPTWGWLLGATGAAGAYYLWEEHKASTASKNSGSGSGTAGKGYVPDYVFQNYNQLPGRRHRKVDPGGPEKGGGGGNDGPFRHVVSENGLSLDELAAGRHTTAKEIIDVTENSGLISKQNLARFKAYVRGGTGKPMPKGLVYYTTTGPAEGS